jgi:hypothetical protein
MTNTLLIIMITGSVVAAGYFLFRFLLKLTTKPVLEVSLVPTDNPRWSDKKKIMDLIDAFQRNGFDLAGNYDCWEMPGLIISGFVKPSEQMIGMIYDHPAAGIWEDICIEYEDGENFTVSNAPMGQEMDHMPQSTKIYLKGSSLEELLVKVPSGRKNKGRKTVNKEDFSSTFEEAYKKEMKWRMERGGPTSLEVKRVADEMAVPLDSEKMQAKTQQLQKIWLEEKNKPKKVKRGLYEAELPGEFQRPEAFRQRMEQKSESMPRMNLPVLPLYVVLITAISYWCYYGYQYNEVHRPVSLTALSIFLLVFLVLFITLMGISIRNQQIKMCPFLKRIADLRQGAFLFIAGASPSLFYAREGWLGKVVFREGGEHQEACTRLESVTKHSGGWLSISRKNIVSKIFGRSEKDNIPLPDSDFGRKFTMSGTDIVLAEKLLNSNIAGTIMRLEEFKKPIIEIDGKSVTVEIGGNLFSTRKETELRHFLELAENIVDTVVQQGG